MGLHFYGRQDSLHLTCVCPEIIPTETEQKVLAGAIIVISKFNGLLKQEKFPMPLCLFAIRYSCSDSIAIYSFSFL